MSIENVSVTAIFGHEKKGLTGDLISFRSMLYCRRLHRGSSTCSRWP